LLSLVHTQDQVTIEGELHRFCTGCNTFHPLQAFADNKKRCTKRNEQAAASKRRRVAARAVTAVTAVTAAAALAATFATAGALAVANKKQRVAPSGKGGSRAA
jgi:hypothetical protein